MSEEKIIENLNLEDFQAIRVKSPGVIIFNKTKCYFFQEEEIIKNSERVLASLYGLKVSTHLSKIGDLV